MFWGLLDVFTADATKKVFMIIIFLAEHIPYIWKNAVNVTTVNLFIPFLCKPYTGLVVVKQHLIRLSKN